MSRVATSAPTLGELPSADFIVFDPGRWGVLSLHHSLPSPVALAEVLRLLEPSSSPSRDRAVDPLAEGARPLQASEHAPLAPDTRVRAVSPVLFVRDAGAVIAEDRAGGRHRLDPADLALLDQLDDRERWTPVATVVAAAGVPDADDGARRLRRLAELARVEVASAAP